MSGTSREELSTFLLLPVTSDRHKGALFQWKGIGLLR